MAQYYIRYIRISGEWAPDPTEGVHYMTEAEAAHENNMSDFQRFILEDGGEQNY